MTKWYSTVSFMFSSCILNAISLDFHSIKSSRVIVIECLKRRKYVSNINHNNNIKTTHESKFKKNARIFLVVLILSEPMFPFICKIENGTFKKKTSTANTTNFLNAVFIRVLLCSLMFFYFAFWLLLRDCTFIWECRIK